MPIVPASDLRLCRNDYEDDCIMDCDVLHFDRMLFFIWLRI